MNKIELVITQKAFEDIDTISDYIAKDNIIVAKSVVEELFNTLYTLTEFPNIGKQKNGIADTSVMVFVHKKKYLIAYKIVNSTVVILRILTKYQDLFAVMN